MGSALVHGCLRSGMAPSKLGVVEKLASLRAELSVRFPEVEVFESPEATRGAVIAVKPADVADACAALAAVRCPRVLSIAAGVTTARLAELLGPTVAVVRAMPNMPALVGEGASAVSAGPGAAESDLWWAEGILGSMGVVVRVAEKHLDAVTGLSGSGPAYVFLLAEAMIEGGVLVGLDRDVSRRLVAQTLLGSACLLAGNDGDPEDPAELREAITSPGGTTAAALRSLDAAGFRSAVIEAIAAATQRSAELGA